MRIRLRWLSVMLLAAVIPFLVISCAPPPTIQVVADPPSGHPCPADGGLCVRVFCTGGEPPYLISFGDGAQATSQTGYAEHTYRPPYTADEYRVSASCETGSGFTDVAIENRSPVFYGIFSTMGNQAAERDFVLLQVNHFAKGCNNCEETCDTYQVFGAVDPDGDLVYYEWRIGRRGTSQEDSVYDVDGNRVNGRAVQGDYFIWFPSWAESAPPWPFSPLPSLSLANDRTQGLRHSDKSILTHPMGHFYTYDMCLTVSDYCGATATYATTWEILHPFD